MKRASKHDIERAAYHEAGHTVVAYLLHEPFKYVSLIEPVGDELGAFVSKRHRSTLDELSKVEHENWIMIFMAGAIAELLFGINPSYSSYSADMNDAILHAHFLVSNENEAEDYARQLAERTKALLEYKPHWSAVQAVARELRKHKYIFEERACEIIQQVIEKEVSIE